MPAPAPPDPRHRLEQFEEVRHRLRQVIHDQDLAIDELVDAFIHMAFQPPREQPPLAIFTFVGPAGVGKLSLARAAVSLLADTAFRAFDMERYAEPEAATQLLAPQVVGDTVQEGELIRFLRANPRCVIAFDGIDKAANSLQLAILDLITNPEHESGVDCRLAIFIFTTSLGASIAQGREFASSWRQHRTRAKSLLMEGIAQERKITGETVQEAIAPRLLTTLSHDYLILFNRLGLKAFSKIATTAVSRLIAHFRTNGIAVELAGRNRLLPLLVLSLAPAITAKRVQQTLPDELLFKITHGLDQQKKTPERIVFKTTKRADQFLSRMGRDGDLLLATLFKNSQTVELTWKQYRRGGALIFSIDHAERRALPMRRELLRTERPAVEFSETGFDHIAGNRQTKTTLRQIIAMLRHPERLARFGLPMPKGILLHGPSGVGKTMLGKAFAQETGRPYLLASRGDLFDPEYIHLLYRKAREYAPSIVFLDGIDVKGVVEGVLTNVPADQLAMELDSLPNDPAESVFTLVTAASLEETPQLLTEAGRVDIFVEVPELDREARRFFIEQILKKPNDGKIDVDRVVRYISGMNGYELQRIGKEASLAAVRQGLDTLTEELLIEQINIIKYGSKVDRKHLRNLEEELRMTAFHEAGHAVLSFLLLPEVKIEQVTIAPRLRTLGFISYNLEDFPGNLSRQEVRANLCVLMAGRAASIRKFGDKGMDTGAANDLEEATQQAYTAVACLGMDEELGNLHTDTLGRNVNRQLYRETVEKRVRHWIEAASRRADELVAANWPRIEMLASVLIRQEIVDGDELGRIMAQSGQATARATAPDIGDPQGTSRH
ncbi:MAG: AAA family ATPase [Thermodesulfobacteriota bacterium]